MKKLPLVNKETKNIPIGSHIKESLKKTPNDIPKLPMLDTSCHFDAPSLHTCKKLIKNIKQIQEENPDLSHMVEEKLGSPNTAKYIRKKKASKVNIKESKKIFKDLVSVDVCEEAIIKELEADLRHRAALSQPAFKAPDIEPSLRDYYLEENHINVRMVGPSNIFPLDPSASLYKSSHKDVTQFCDKIMDLYQ